MIPLIGVALRVLPQALKAADTATNLLQGANAAADLVAQIKPSELPVPKYMVADAAGGDRKINY
jgi:hypothetical protein